MSDSAPLGWQTLPWDSKFFGISIGRITERHLSGSQLKSRLNAASACQVRCLYWLADQHVAVDVTPHQSRILDKRISYRRKLVLESLNHDPDGEIRRAQAEDEPVLVDLARASHTNTRFWEDPGFSPSLASDLYAEWVRSALADLTTQVLVFGPVGRPLGYLTVAIEAGREAMIGLVAVESRERGSGWGHRLVNAGISLASTNGSTSISVATQGRNLAARRLYEGLGFDPFDQGFWIHFWLQGDRGNTL